MKSSTIVVWVVVAIAALGGLEYWDEQREAGMALDDFAAEQATVAHGAAAALQACIDSGPVPGAEPSPELLAPLEAVEDKGSVQVLVRRPGTDVLQTTSGATVRAPDIVAALSRAKSPSWVQITRADAAALGLPARTAMAGLARARPRAGGTWGVAIIATAERQRDRELRAQWRLGLGFFLSSGLVLAFGTLALRKQRKELELAHRLELALAVQARDEELVRADKLASLGALATGIAHEVSTPLGVIVGRAEQLAPKVAGDEKARRAVDAIAEQAERIGRVIRGFLGLVRSGTPTLEHVPPSLVVREAVDLVEHRFRRAEVTLSAEVPQDLPLVACDARLFEQVLVNLLLNACDACEAGGRVDVTVRGDGERVGFVVVNDGVGISAAAVAHAGEPFFTTKPPGRGTGLGLAIATEIVKLHHGTLTVSPRTGEGTRGTRACVEMPALFDPVARRRASSRPPPADGSSAPPPSLPQAPGRTVTRA